MSALDFLFEGTPPPSTTTYGQQTTNIPQFMSDYTQGLLAQANSVAAIPYQPYQGPRVAGMTDMQNQGFQQVQDTVGDYQQPLNAGIGFATDAGNTDVLSGANPYLQQSAQMAQQGAMDPSAAMNPYTKNVIDQAGLLAGQNFSNYILPSLQNNFVKAGQYGSAGMQRAVGQQVNQTQQALQGQAQAALSDAYKTAQSGLFQGSSNLGQLGATTGQLGALQGQLQLGAGQQLGALGQMGQQLGLQGAAALDASGQEQQNLNQTNLNTAYQDFQNQTQYPQNQVGWLSNIIRGQPMSTTIDKSQTGPGTLNPSLLSQLISGTNQIKALGGT